MENLNSNTYIEKKAFLSPVFFNERGLYCLTYDAFSKGSLYLLNYFNQLYKKPSYVLFTNKEEFLSFLETKQSKKLLFQEETKFYLENFINIIVAAQGCSDIHFIPIKDKVYIFFRKAGLLKFFNNISKGEAINLFNLVKIRAQIDLTKRHIPQNGQLMINLPNKTIFGRVSTLPCLHGESMVIRLHMPEKNAKYDYSSLDNSLFSQTFLKAKPGLWLITGPIGHGKTTSYYHLLKQINHQRVLSLEDPLEIEQKDIVQLRLSSNMTESFYTRMILRQNVNVVGIGEIRSQENLKLAINLAITGHCTIATFHAGSLQDVQQRLEHFGYDRNTQTKFLKGVLFQSWGADRKLTFQE